MFLFDSYIYDCELQDTKTFTRTLKEFQKIFRKYPRFEPKDAKYIFDNCAKLFRTKQNPTIQANAIKLAKFTVTSTRYMQEHFVDPWQLYRETIFHDKERVRKAGIELVRRYYFGMKINTVPIPDLKIDISQEKREKLKKFLMFNYMHLMYLEKKYMKEHGIWPTKEEIYENPGIFLASSTEDPILKNIRRGVESFGSGKYMNEVMTENGYMYGGYYE